MRAKAVSLTLRRGRARLGERVAAPSVTFTCVVAEMAGLVWSCAARLKVCWWMFGGRSGAVSGWARLPAPSATPLALSWPSKLKFTGPLGVKPAALELIGEFAM